MKRRIPLLLSALLVTFTTSCSAQPQTVSESQNAVIILQIGNPVMTVGDMEYEIDPGRSAVPIIMDNRTLLPIRAVVGAMGCAFARDEETRTTALANGNNKKEHRLLQGYAKAVEKGDISPLIGFDLYKKTVADSELSHRAEYPWRGIARILLTKNF
ncbi:MAG: stalk domain-containing protein [Clostridia bacterium]|nr:stalk domain-containing protein [Clostridia bacterium]